MVSVPERALQLTLAVAVQITTPVLEPLAGAQVSQPGALLDTLQLQPLPAFTVKVPLLATAPGLAPGEESEYVQGVAPACDTENVCPATVSVPLRGVVLVLAETE